MKVKIGTYKNWVGPYQISNAIFFWVDRRGIFADDPPIYSRWDYKAEEKLGDWLADRKWLRAFCNWIHKKKKRKVKIHIDNYDIWSMDHTLALIIHPMLIKIKENKHGSPFVYDEDVPENIRSTSAPPKKNEWDTDDNFHQRWEYVLGEMIWAFEQELDDDWEDQFRHGTPVYVDEEVEHEKYGTCYTFKQTNPDYWVDREGIKEYNDRINNGMRLFGKYYRGLWD